MNSGAETKGNGKAIFLMIFFAGIILFFSLPVFGQTLRPRLVVEQSPMQSFAPDKRDNLSYEVKYRLLTMKDYTVFDWLEAKANANGEVTLRGQVTDEAIKEKAEQMLDGIGGVKRINNLIEVLPLSETDRNLRKQLYRAVYNQNTSLSRYAVVTAPTIHIIVKNGSVDLRGAVDSSNDSEMAFVAANAVPRVAHVTNNLKVNDGGARVAM